MPRVDTNGVIHPLPTDEFTAWGAAHISTCPECGARYAGTPIEPMPLATSGAEAEALLDAGAQAVIVIRAP